MKSTNSYGIKREKADTIQQFVDFRKDNEMLYCERINKDGSKDIIEGYYSPFSNEHPVKVLRVHFMGKSSYGIIIPIDSLVDHRLMCLLHEHRINEYELAVIQLTTQPKLPRVTK